MKRFFLIATALVLLAPAAPAVEYTAGQPIDVNEPLAPWRTYYESRDDWPRAHGWKPFKRYEWDLIQRGGTGGTIPAGAMWEANLQRGRLPRVTLDEPWRNLGPANHGGRTRTLRFHPGNPTIMYAGSVGGGLWKSTDAGESWLPMTDHLPNLAVGCFEIDQTNPQIMYLGTGEGYFNGDAVHGIGLLKSTDGGLSWNTTALAYPYSQGQNILKINLDPRNGQIVLASTNGGLRRSTDGAQSFTVVLSGNVNELRRDPQNPDILLAGVGDPWGSAQNGIYRSTDNGLTWSRTSTGLPAQSRLGRIVIAYYPGNSQVVYAGVSGTFSDNGSQMIGVFRSTDNGLSWTQMSPAGANHYASQAWYDMAIAVQPNNSAMIFSSGLDIHRSTNSGNSWSRKSWWNYDFGNPDYVHADHHEIVFHPNNPNEIWTVTDGGIFKSTDLAENWVEKNNGFITFQYYAMGNATLDTVVAYGGTQDNGTFRYPGHSAHEPVFGGDGGYCVVDYTNNNTVYVEWQNGNRYRSDDGGSSFSEINPGIDGTGPWVTPMVLDPFDHLTIYTTTNSNDRVWKSPNQGRGGNWQTVGQALSGGMQVLEASPTVPGRLYLGTSNSVYRYDTGGNWVNVTGNLPNGYVTRVVPDPFDPAVVYVTLSGFGYGHVWKSTQGGTVWQDISGDLPNMPFQDVVVDRREPSTLYAGGDIGVYRTTNGGQSWHVFGEGLPAARVDDMDIQTVTGVLRVATHGRGMWEIPTGSALLAVLYPNGGELLSPGQEIDLRWSGTSFGGTVTIEINRDYPSATWTALFTNTPNDGVQRWTVTGPASDRVRFRIRHAGPPARSDTSNADTRIVLPALALLWPQAGDTVLTGQRAMITFERTLVPDPLRIELNRDYPNGTWEEIASNVGTQTEIPWFVRQPVTAHARIRIVSEERPTISVMNDGEFVIRAPQMTLLAPNGGERLPAGSPTQILWSAAEHNGTIRLLLNREYPEGSWEIISPNTNNDGVHPWSPAPPASERCRLRVTTAFDPDTYAESAADFAITAAAADAPVLPRDFAVSEPYPNPFNPATRITVELPSQVRLVARVFNRLGQEVAVLADDDYKPGKHDLRFDGSALPSGLYFIRLEAYGHVQIMKAALIK